jgi:spore photoproduct lyase
MFDRETGIGTELIRRAAAHPHIMLELKTKSANVDHLMNVSPKGNAVLSWSLASERNIRRYERGSANLAERLAAIRKASEAHFITAFHFDPVIIYDGWKEDYSALLDALFEAADPETVAWISMGGFRYAPGFKEVLKRVEPDEEMTLAEMFPGVDGKLRYFKPIRIEMYKFLLDRIGKYTSKPFIYLCMESSDVWRQVMGKDYSTSEELEVDFSNAMKRFLKSLK